MFFKRSLIYLLIVAQIIPYQTFATMEVVEPLNRIANPRVLNSPASLPGILTRTLEQDASRDIPLNLSSFTRNGCWKLSFQGNDDIGELVRFQDSVWIDVKEGANLSFKLIASSPLKDLTIIWNGTGNGTSFTLDKNLTLENLTINKIKKLSIPQGSILKVSHIFQGVIDEYYGDGKQKFGERASLLVKDFSLSGKCKGKFFCVRAENDLSTSPLSSLNITNQLYLHSYQTYLKGSILFGAKKNLDENKGMYIKGDKDLVIESSIRANAEGGIQLGTNGKAEINSKIYTTWSDEGVVLKAFDAEIKGLINLGQSLTVLAEKNVKMFGVSETSSTSVVSMGNSTFEGTHSSSDIFTVHSHEINNKGTINGKRGALVAQESLKSQETNFKQALEMHAQHVELKSHNRSIQKTQDNPIPTTLMISQKSSDKTKGIEILPGGQVKPEVLIMTADGDINNKGVVTPSLLSVETKAKFTNDGVIENEQTSVKAHTFSNLKTLNSKAFESNTSWFYNKDTLTADYANISAYGVWNSGKLTTNKYLSVKSGLLINAAPFWRKPALMYSHESMYLQSGVKLNLNSIVALQNLTSVSGINIDVFTAAKNLTSISLLDASLIKAGVNVTDIAIWKLKMPIWGVNGTDLFLKSRYYGFGGGIISENYLNIASSEALSMLKNMAIGQTVTYLDQKLGITKFVSQQSQSLYNAASDYLMKSSLGPSLKAIESNERFKKIKKSYEEAKNFYKTYRDWINLALVHSGKATYAIDFASKQSLIAWEKTRSFYKSHLDWINLDFIPEGRMSYIVDLSATVGGATLETAKKTREFIVNQSLEFLPLMGRVLTEGPTMVGGCYLIEKGLSQTQSYIPESVKNYALELQEKLYNMSSFSNGGYTVSFDKKVDSAHIDEHGKTYTWNLTHKGNLNHRGNTLVRNYTHMGKRFKNTGHIAYEEASLDLAQDSEFILGSLQGTRTNLNFKNLSGEQQDSILSYITNADGYGLQTYAEGKVNVFAHDTNWVTEKSYHLDNKDYSINMVADSLKANYNFSTAGNFSFYATKGDIANKEHFYIGGKGQLIAANGALYNHDTIQANNQLWVEASQGVHNISQVTYSDGSYAHYAKPYDLESQFSINQGDTLDRRYQNCHVKHAQILGGTGEDLKIGDEIFENVGLVLISGGELVDNMGRISSKGTNFINAKGKISFNGLTHNHMVQLIKTNQHFWVQPYMSEIVSETGKNYIFSGDTVIGDAPVFKSDQGTYISALNDIDFSALPMGGHSWSPKNTQHNIQYVGPSAYNRLGDVTLHSAAGNITADNIGVKTPGAFNVIAEQGYFQFNLIPNLNESTKTKKNKFLSVLGFSSGGKTPNPLAIYQKTEASIKALEAQNNTVGKAMAIYDTAINMGEAIVQGANTINNFLNGDFGDIIAQHLPMNVHMGVQKTKSYIKIETHPGDRTNFECGNISFQSAKPSTIQNNIIAPGTMALIGPKFSFSSLPLQSEFSFSTKGGLVGAKLDGGLMAGYNQFTQSADFLKYSPQVVKVGHLNCNVGELSLNGTHFEANSASGHIDQLTLQAPMAKGKMKTFGFQAGYNVPLDWNKSSSTYHSYLPSKMIIKNMNGSDTLRVEALDNYGGQFIANNLDQIHLGKVTSHTLFGSGVEKLYGVDLSRCDFAPNEDQLFFDHGQYHWGHNSSSVCYNPFVGAETDYRSESTTSSSKRVFYNLNTRTPTDKFWEKIANLVPNNNSVENNSCEESNSLDKAVREDDIELPSALNVPTKGPAVKQLEAKLSKSNQNKAQSMAAPNIPAKSQEIKSQHATDSHNNKDSESKNKSKVSLKFIPSSPFIDDNDPQELEGYHHYYSENDYPSIGQSINYTAQHPLTKPIWNVAEEGLPFLSTIRISFDPNSSFGDIAKDAVYSFLDLELFNYKSIHKAQCFIEGIDGLLRKEASNNDIFEYQDFLNCLHDSLPKN